MARLSYRQADLVLKKDGGTATRQQIRDLQRDLRQLGYLKSGIDGQFGNQTRRAVQALQYELLNNDGTGKDAPAPVRVLDYNRGRVMDVTGEVDQALVSCIADMLEDPNFATLPFAEDPVAENGKITAAVTNMPSTEVPIPFLLGVLKQESGLKHFVEPKLGDEDTYVVLGTDVNATEPFVITSRGYGVGQYTLFHHPSSNDEVKDFMLDPIKNVEKSIHELKKKFEYFINGSTTGTRADDRMAEYGTGPLRVCRYDAQDHRYMKDCKRCAQDAGFQTITEEVTPLYIGSPYTYQPTQYYRTASYKNVPIRKNIQCGWPYAVRRYNGAGMNSYHYQVRILKSLLS